MILFEKTLAEFLRYNSVRIQAAVKCEVFWNPYNPSVADNPSHVSAPALN